MRKRAQRKTPLVEEIQKPKKVTTEKKKITFKKNWWIAVSLIGIFFLVLLLNSYFNITSGVAINPAGETVNEKFYLSGPDPYYNMRLVENTIETGRYPFYSEDDPILNYPLGRSGGRAPLLNMVAIGFSRVLTPFMSEVDAVGYSMQFVPALFGALVIFPVYFIGKTLFGRKEGLVAALLVAIIPIHIGSGHGSAYALFDHDSFNLLLFFLIFLFLIKSIKEKDSRTSILYALLSGVSVAALTMVWVEARFVYTVIGLYAVVQMLIDIFTNKIDRRFVRNILIILFTGYFVSLPVIYAKVGLSPDLSLFIGVGIALFGLLYIILDKKKIPWILSLPAIFCAGVSVAAVLYFINPLISAFSFLSPLTRLSEILYGSGVYGSKVDITVAEAGTYSISRSVMSYGPALYWLAWAGLVLLIIHYLKQKGRRDYLFIIMLFLINIWLASSAGRFLNDMVPLIAILAGWITWFVIDKIDYKQMLRNIRNAGGGLRGVRKGVKIFHILGILFIAFLVIMPNALLALDAAVPRGVPTKNGKSTMKIDFFGYKSDDESPFGSGSYKEQYWVDALSWLKDQDTDIEDPAKRPAFISWWDYGFYESAVGAHPTVADNFQTGIPPAANFHTAKGEKEGVAVWIVRILEGNVRDNDGSLSTDVVNIFKKYIGEDETNSISKWIENPTSSPSYNTPIGEEYDEKIGKELLVGEQYIVNAFYHDITEMLNNTLDDEGITWLYHELQEATGYSIRYYGVEGYDVQIFNIFGFLGDKSLLLHASKKIKYLPMLASDLKYNAEDDFIETVYALRSAVYPQGHYLEGQIKYPDLDGQEKTFAEIQELSEVEKDEVFVVDINTRQKDDYYKTMFYRTYIGNIPEELQNQVVQLPCWGMRHFSAEFISMYPYYGGRSAVVIAKYYEGAIINGSITYMGEPLDTRAVIRKDISGSSFLIDHDKIDTENGTFSLIAPAGNITLELRRYAELGLNAFPMKTIVFNSTDDLELAPITDDESMRINGTNYERFVNVTIEPSNIEGYVYLNKDNNESYNASTDQPLSDVKVTLTEITELQIENDQLIPVQVGVESSLNSNESGYYNFSDLMPGYYIITAELDDFAIHAELIPIFSGNISYNISKPKPAAIEGTVYFDENENDQFDDGEEMSNVNVEILYSRGNKFVDSLITDETGRYTFSSLIPGQYIINATRSNSTTRYLDYAIEEEVALNENETTTFNVSITYAPIILSGYSTHNNENIEDISIEFSVNESIENNTAQDLTVISDDEGMYEAELMPGYYNITVDERGEGEKGWYTFIGQLFIEMGEGVKSFEISMTKNSTTVSGHTKYDNINVANITIMFSPDWDAENNTAVDASVQSDENGAYIAELMPGTYEVSVEETVNESGQNVTYTYEGQLEVQTDDVAITFDIVMTREEA